MALLAEHLLHASALPELEGATLDRWKALTRWRSRLIMPVPAVSEIKFPAPDVLVQDGSRRRVQNTDAPGFWPAADDTEWSESHLHQARQVGASVVLVGGAAAVQVLGNRRTRTFRERGRKRRVVARPEALDLALDIACQVDERQVSLGSAFILFRPGVQGHRVPDVAGPLFHGTDPVEIVDGYALTQDAFGPLCELLTLVFEEKRDATLIFRAGKADTRGRIESQFQRLRLIPVNDSAFKQLGHDRFVRCGDRVLMLGRGLAGFQGNFESTAALLDDAGRELRGLANRLKQQAQQRGSGR